MEGELLQVHHDLNNRRNGEDALRTEVKEIQDSRPGMTQELDLCFRRVDDQIDRTKPAKRKNNQPKAHQVKEKKKRDKLRKEDSESDTDDTSDPDVDSDSDADSEN